MAYANSPLVVYTNLSPNHSGQRTHSIDRITPHCVVGQLSAESICGCFISPSRQASCNYGIGKDGRVSLCVEEKNRSWCSSSAANDQRAITIECASDLTHPYAMNSAVYTSLIKLCTDICKRNGKTKLLWLGDKNKTLNYAPASDEMVLTVHRWYANKQTWNKTALKYLLENEKYIGDMRLQKWVSVDHISHRSVRNDSTVIPVYNVRNHHVPIIDRHTYQQVQRIMELKSPHGEYSRYPYFDTNIVCPLCGKKMIPRVMKVNSHKRILGCFDVDGCRGYAVKGYLVDAALLEAYNTLEIKEKKRTVAMQRMLEIKAESPKLDTVQYYWLDDLVGHIEFKQDTMRVFWKCGLESEVALNASKVEEPTHVAELYRNSLDRAQRSENKPVSVVRADKKSVNTREAQRNAAMQTAKNLRAKENGVAANDY